MASPFARTLRSLERDGDGAWWAGLVPTLVLLCGWAVWFVSMRVAVYEVSERAWLSVDREAHVVAAPVAGRVARIHLNLGQRVRGGDVVAQLDGEEQRARLDEQRERAEALARQIAVLRRQMAADRIALADRSRATAATLAEAAARATEAQSAAVLAAREADRQSVLLANGLVSEAAASRASAEADQRRAAGDSSRRALDRLVFAERTAVSDRRENLVKLEGDLERMNGERRSVTAAVERLEHDLDLRTIRAPISGRVGQIASVHAGAIVEPGTVLGMIVPEGEIKVVADFAPASALGRIRPAQSARVRLTGFPSTQYGSLRASVAEVSDEPRDGRIRIELRVRSAGRLNLPLEHGMPASVEVDVEHVTPAVLVLRTIGRVVDRPTTDAPVTRAAG